MKNVLCVSAGALVIAGASQADFVDLTFVGAGAGQWVHIVSPDVTGLTFAGQILVDLSNSTGFNVDGSWITYCTDLGQAMNFNTTETYELLDVADLPVGDPMGVVKATAINELYAFANGAQYTSDNDFAAAFQLAIWEIVIDYTGGPILMASLGAGSFQAYNPDLSPLSGGIATYLSALLGAVGSGNTTTLIGLGNDIYQDQIIEVPGPGVLAAGALGALLTGGRRRRR